MLHRYVCAGIALLALGGTVRADPVKELETILASPVLGIIRSAGPKEIIFTPHEQLPGVNQSVMKLRVNTPSVQVVKLKIRPDASGKFESAISGLKLPFQGQKSSLDELKTALEARARAKELGVLAIIKIPPTDAKEKLQHASVTDIGYVHETQPVTIDVKITVVNDANVVVTTADKRTRTFKFPSKKVFKGVGQSTKLAPVTIAEAAQDIKNQPGGLSGSLTFIPAENLATSITYKVPEATSKTPPTQKQK
jgi:hypothetical protein